MIWLQTYTGRIFQPLDPRPEDVDVEDIAHALGFMCRFNGHCKRFYSVAEHSVRVAELVPDHLIKLALLHDAAEVYLSDMPRPVKPALKEYAVLERRILLCVLQKFDIPLNPEHWAEVRHADMVMLATEARDLMCEPPQEWDLMPEPLVTRIEEMLDPLSYAELWLEIFNED